MSGELPRNKAEIKLQLALPDTAESLSTLAKIVWIRKVTKDADSQLFQVGVKFMNSDEKIRDTLWNYIVASSPVARP
jgi:Tfp pilus assembly protein PilZ